MGPGYVSSTTWGGGGGEANIHILEYRAISLLFCDHQVTESE